MCCLWLQAVCTWSRVVRASKSKGQPSSCRGQNFSVITDSKCKENNDLTTLALHCQHFRCFHRGGSEWFWMLNLVCLTFLMQVT